MAEQYPFCMNRGNCSVTLRGPVHLDVRVVLVWPQHNKPGSVETHLDRNIQHCLAASLHLNFQRIRKKAGSDSTTKLLDCEYLTRVSVPLVLQEPLFEYVVHL